MQHQCVLSRGALAPQATPDQACWRVPQAGAGPTPPVGALDTPHAGQRWKFLDDAKLRKVSGRLFSAEPSLRRSSKVAPSPMEASPDGRTALGASGDAHGSAEAAYGGEAMLSGARLAGLWLHGLKGLAL